MNHNILQIQKFNPNKIKAGEDVCLIIGKRNTGKSYLLRDILSHIYDKFQCISVFSQTEHLNHFYEKFIPKFLINREWDETKIEKIFKCQDNAKNKGIIHNFGLIFDDMISEASIWRNNVYIKKIFLEGRHCNLGFFLLTQFVNALPPYAKNNVDYVFILQQQNNQEKERLYKEFGGAFPHKKLFIQVLDSITENYGCLVIDNKSKSNKLEERVFGYCAGKNPPEYKFGRFTLWNKQREIEMNNSLKISNETKEITLTKGKKIILEKLNPRTLEPNRRFFFIGKTNTGKSYLLRDIMYYIKDKYKKGLAFSASESINSFYSTLMDRKFIFNKHNSSILQQAFNHQQYVMNKLNKKHRYFYIIYDDMIADAKSWSKDPLIVNLFTLGRHYNIGFFLLSQYTNAVPPYAKNNVDYIFILQQQNYEEKLRLYKEYGSIFESKKDFYTALDQLTTDNGCMVINNTIKSNKIEKRVFYYKADRDPPNYILN